MIISTNNIAAIKIFSLARIDNTISFSSVVIKLIYNTYIPSISIMSSIFLLCNTFSIDILKYNINRLTLSLKYPIILYELNNLLYLINRGVLGDWNCNCFS